MKKEKQKNKTFSEIVEDIRQITQDNASNIDTLTLEKMRSVIHEADLSIEAEKKVEKGMPLFVILFVAFILGGYVLAFIFDYQRENLQRDINQKEDIIQKMQWSDSLFHKFMDVKYDSAQKADIMSYRSVKGKYLRYQDLVRENDSLQYRIDNYKIRLDLAEKVYGIKFKKKGETTSIIAPSVDSAMLLLPHYRHKIRYDRIKKVWITTYTDE